MSNLIRKSSQNFDKMDATKGAKNGTTHVLFAKFGGSKSLIDGKLLYTLWKNSQNVMKRATNLIFLISSVCSTTLGLCNECSWHRI